MGCARPGAGVVTSVVWFRRDLRLNDHPALTAAIEAGGNVYPVFVLDSALLEGRWASANRTAFLLETLRCLDASLQDRGSRLHVRTGDPRIVIPALAVQLGATGVFVSREYAPYGRARDSRIRAALESASVRFHEVHGGLVVEPGDIVPATARPPHTYSNFKKRWDAIPLRVPHPQPARIKTPGVLDPGALPAGGPVRLELPAAGEAAARIRLDRFLASSVSSYASDRDMLGLESATSRISQDLRFGLLSPAEVVTRARTHGPSAGKFVAEVAWRDFYAHVLWHNPRLLHEPEDVRFQRFPWRNDPADLAAWCAGKTGYPVVDAAMRQLVATGFMHNRARMVAASFLAKHLLIDWREGERFFMRHLVDGDPASNNGGWQWTAGCGTDAQPFFRIFNPILQGKRFDPDGEYVRRWLPALRDVPAAFVHSPWEMPAETQQIANCVVGRDYPAPIVNHAEARQLALDAFATLKRGPV